MPVWYGHESLLSVPISYQGAVRVWEWAVLVVKLLGCGCVAAAYGRCDAPGTTPTPTPIPDAPNCGYIVGANGVGTGVSCMDNLCCSQYGG